MNTEHTRKTRSKRSRHGCRTCRIRRVKCDEAPGECQRCISTGRKCEGYDYHRLPWGSKKNRIVLNSLLSKETDFLVASSSGGRTTDERRSFSFFQSCTVPMMNSWFDHDLWDYVFLQLSMAEPSICHAVIAVGALHEENQTAGNAMLSGEIHSSGHRRFALEQYGRAIAALNARMGSNDPEVKNTVLLCCFLFIVFELFSGDCDAACEHLQQGIVILDEHNRTGQRRVLDETYISKSLISSMTHLDDQAIYFGKSRSRSSLNAPPINVNHHNPITLDTLAAAVRVRNCFLSTLSEFLAFYESLSSDNITRHWSTLCVWQQHMRALLAQFQCALDRLEEDIKHGSADGDKGLLKEKQRHGFNILRLHYALFSLQTDLCFLEKQQRVEDELYALRFCAIVEQCEYIASTLNDEDKKGQNHRQPSHLMEIGVIQPLFYVCERCADHQIVQRAMKALENWPHREGLWTSRLALRLALENVNLQMPRQGSEFAQIVGVDAVASYLHKIG